jgi:hypothetical protein
MAVKAVALVALVALAAVGALVAIGLIANPIGAITLGAIGGVFLTALIVNIAMKRFSDSQSSKIESFVKGFVDFLDGKKIINPFEKSLILSQPSDEDEKKPVDSSAHGIRPIYLRPEQKGASLEDVSEKSAEASISINKEGSTEVEVPETYYKDQIKRSYEGKWKYILGKTEYALSRTNNLEFISKCQDWVNTEFKELTENQKEQVVFAILEKCSQQPVLRFIQSTLTSLQLGLPVEGSKTDTEVTGSFIKMDDGKLQLKLSCLAHVRSGDKDLYQVKNEYVLNIHSFSESGWKEELIDKGPVVINFSDEIMRRFPGS